MASKAVYYFWLPLARLRLRLFRKPELLSTLAESKTNKIMVISNTAIGDTLISLPAINALRQRWPQARLVVMMHRRVAPLFHSCKPDVDEVVALGGLFCRAVWQVWWQRPDAVVVLHGNDPDATLLAHFSGARWVVKQHWNHFEAAFLSPMVVEGDPYQDHAIVSRLKLVEKMGASPDRTRMELAISDELEDAGCDLLVDHGIESDDLLIGFQIGAAKPYKMWPGSRFAALAKKIFKWRAEARVIFLGSPDEQEMVAAVCREINDARAINLAGEPDLALLPGVVKSLNLLVTNDTGAMHLAIAVDVGTISLFCPTRVSGVGPMQERDRHLVIEKPIPCDPCITKRCEEPFCMEQIEVDEVFQTIIMHPCMIHFEHE